MGKWLKLALALATIAPEVVSAVKKATAKTPKPEAAAPPPPPPPPPFTAN